MARGAEGINEAGKMRSGHTFLDFPKPLMVPVPRKLEASDAVGGDDGIDLAVVVLGR